MLDRVMRGYIGSRRSHPHREAGAAYRHGRRLMNGVIELRKRITDDASHDDALRVAALFHDIKKGEEPHGESGARIASELLRGRTELRVLREALTIIRLHDDMREERDIFLSIFRDADLLDHIGCYEIWMSFVHCFDTGRGMEDALNDWYLRKFDRSMEDLRRGLHFDESRRIFDDKVAFERAFRERLMREANGLYADIQNGE